MPKPIRTNKRKRKGPKPIRKALPILKPGEYFPEGPEPETVNVQEVFNDLAEQVLPRIEEAARTGQVMVAVFQPAMEGKVQVFRLTYEFPTDLFTPAVDALQGNLEEETNRVVPRPDPGT